MARLHPADDPHTPVHFLSLDALAAHLLQQRPGRRIRFQSVAVADGGDAPFPGLLVFAVRPQDEAALAEDWKPFAAMTLGWTAGGLAADPDAMNAAVERVRSAGGLAA